MIKIQKIGRMAKELFQIRFDILLLFANKVSIIYNFISFRLSFSLKICTIASYLFLL